MSSPVFFVLDLEGKLNEIQEDLRKGICYFFSSIRQKDAVFYSLENKFSKTMLMRERFQDKAHLILNIMIVI
jgi:hypothetical protein